MTRTKRLALLLCIVMLTSIMSSLTVMAEEKPDTWIADRVVQIQAYVDDIGYALPEDQLNTPVMQELARRTGMKIEFLYTEGEKDRYVMATQLATGNLPDMIVSYLNNSTRPEFPILLKAARDGMFADLAPFIIESKVYSKYMDKEYLPADTYDNIVWRKDFDGQVHFLHMNIDAVDTSTIWNPAEEYIGGMYIQRAIAEDLGIDVKTINTSEQLFKLLQDIKAKEYKDVSGNPVTPLGPKFWGGSADALQYVINDLFWGVSGDYNITEDGKVLHEAETDWVYKKVDWLRKALAEGLMHKEFFTIDETRAGELYANKSIAIIADVHSYKEIIYGSDDWIPLGPIANYKGDTRKITSGKGGRGQWAIPASTENPEEVFKLMDYLSSEEGQLLCLYGVEGVSYDMVDGKPKLKPEVQEAMDRGDSKTLCDKYGASFDGSGVYGLEFILTDRQNEAYFGEARPGASSGSTFERSVKLAEEYTREYHLVPGLPAKAFLTDLEDVNNAMNLLNYNETLVQAAFAESDAKVKEIIESFREQLKHAGIEKFEKLVEEKYAENPNLINFY
ncbi:MAG: extracellular solute-binding protein [Clostridiales bacterium]|nr:extracellular solute-binding protein [Clostridiales bacterium]